MRSRLEARWAVYLDTLGLQWEYEPEGFETSAGRYLPDFLLRVRGQVWAEVKPTIDLITEGELARMRAFADMIGHPLLLLVGTPQMQMYPSVYHDTTAQDLQAFKPMEWGSSLSPSHGIWWQDPCEHFFKNVCTLADRRALCDAVLAARAARFEQ